MIARRTVLALAVLTSAASTSLVAQTMSSKLRGPTPLNEVGPAAPMTPPRNTIEREVRNYPEQPPVIPHTIEGYQIDMNGNKCLSCHARARTGSCGLRWSASPTSWTATASSSPRCRHAAFSALNAMYRSTW